MDNKDILKDRLQNLRKEIDDLTLNNSLIGDEMIGLSEALDDLINEWYKISAKEK